MKDDEGYPVFPNLKVLSLYCYNQNVMIIISDNKNIERYILLITLCYSFSCMYNHVLLNLAQRYLTLNI